MPPQRDPYALLNLLLLAALALLLLLPLLGLTRRPPIPLVAALLAARLALTVVRARRDPRYRRPTAWLLDAALVALLLFGTEH
ncbi:hypothetical protein [Deinococcus maricopensis]|uniref:hypothetical protein n=1 Tax=Deinococcus maricopensis TaxID=309887 RepID=UPI001FE03C08|nr:hypothetical protein [Deinococcus maricopensis]